jgi:hypothetical protein
MDWTYQPLARLAAGLGLIGVLLSLAGCPATHSERSDNEVVAPPAAEPQSSAASPDRQASESAEEPAPAEEVTPPADSPPPVEALLDWQLDGFQLGMSVPEARARIRGEMQNYVQERWRYEGVTGVIVAGTYNEPIGMQGSLMFYDGELVAVVANKLEELVTFNQKLAELGKTYGESQSEPPEFARGYRFIREMAAEEQQPDRQFMWADDTSQTLLLAGYYSEDMLATYMLIDASRYDLVAEAMAEVPPSESDAGPVTDT